MENRYLFRGKRIDNGEWVFGDLVHSVYKIGDTCVGQYGTGVGMHEVDPETVCQCTGLKDKTGKLIWENDIVKDEHGNLYKAFWQSDYYQFSWICVNSEIFQVGIKWDLYIMKSFEIEVIGNMIDNPELLEKENRKDSCGIKQQILQFYKKGQKWSFFILPGIKHIISKIEYKEK